MCQRRDGTRLGWLQSFRYTATLCTEAAPEGVRVHVVRERPRSVDFDHGQPLAVPRLQLGIAADVDLPKVELDLLANREQDIARTVAQVAALRVVENDLGYG